MTKIFKSLDNIYYGDTITVHKVSKELVNSFIEKAINLGCKLITIKYGVFYFKDIRHILRQEAIEKLDIF